MLLERRRAPRTRVLQCAALHRTRQRPGLEALRQEDLSASPLADRAVRGERLGTQAPRDRTLRPRPACSGRRSRRPHPLAVRARAAVERSTRRPARRVPMRVWGSHLRQWHSPRMRPAARVRPPVLARRFQTRPHRCAALAYRPVPTLALQWVGAGSAKGCSRTVATRWCVPARKPLRPPVPVCSPERRRRAQRQQLAMRPGAAPPSPRRRASTLRIAMTEDHWALHRPA